MIAKKYEIDAPIGTGPQGASYLARVIASGKKVVVKVLAGPSAPEAQAQELLQRLQTIGADSVIKPIETGEYQGRRWIVSEHFEGESLRRLMDAYAGERKPFTLQEACQIIVKVLEAAEAAHQQGLVHRHVKPTNVIVQSKQVGPGQGRVVRTIKLTGLGFSDLVHPAVLQEGLTERAGDTRYMAPELSSPSQGGGPQTDVYSAGVMFYELLCGQTPMGTYLSPTQIREDLPKHVDDIVDIAIAANAEDRYPSARDMINDIQRAFQDDDKPVAGLSKKALAAVIGLTVAVAGAVGVFVALNDPDDAAARKDQELRATLARQNQMPPEDVVRAKLEAHPDMVYIPTGTYAMGRMHLDKLADPTEPLAQTRKVDGFFVDRFEWENAKGGHALVNVTWEKAQELCASKGKRLCTTEEWERACKGPENRIYAYGNDFNPEKCGADVATDSSPRDERADRASGDLADCVSGWGVFDLSGGTREWTSSDAKATKKFKVLKGGKAQEAARGSRCAFSDERNPGLTDRSIGFRCCLSDDGVAGGAGEGATPPAGGAPPAEGAGAAPAQPPPAQPG
ncbi:MAG: protein kinase domain-containing protein [Myxococcota bacterium]